MRQITRLLVYDNGKITFKYDTYYTVVTVERHGNITVLQGIDFDLDNYEGMSQLIGAIEQQEQLDELQDDMINIYIASPRGSHFRFTVRDAEEQQIAVLVNQIDTSKFREFRYNMCYTMVSGILQICENLVYYNDGVKAGIIG